MLQILNFRMRRAFWENFGENCRRERQKIVPSRSRKTRMKPSKTGKPLPKSQLDFESFSLRPLRYISKYIFMANLRFVYRKSALKLGTVAVRILLENASFRQVPKPVRTSKLTFSRVTWRHSAKHPLGFRVVLVTTTSIHLHIQIMLWSAVQTSHCQSYSFVIIPKIPPSVNWFSLQKRGRTQHQHARIIGIGQPVAADLPHKFPPVVEIFAKYYYFKAILYKRLPGSL